ncbi:hypothetical protein D187_008734 [Cystobacter fuscus DSM 2262]|uniref:Uncharacterized protein n=1 Tax=Cystobacter fuscus (strain ATCC 25194 / DSM 2262 / NBRC 100088 / M29) TaxID=1242864 RepID=S9PHL7_CYSF2|nr:hypothetical protein D187_008734 [Cystobacter fuscus DSM 2262]
MMHLDRLFTGRQFPGIVRQALYLPIHAAMQLQQACTLVIG